MRSFVLAGVVAVLCAGAPASAGDTAYITGRVVDTAGRPVAGARVSFELHPNREVYNQADCAVRSWEIQCKVHKSSGTTNSAGRYRLPVNLSSYLAEKKEHDLFVTDRARSGVKNPARTAVKFYFNGKSMPVIDLPVWRGTVSVGPASSGRRTVHLDALPASLGRTYSAGPVVELMQGGGVAWQLREMTSDRNVDARIVETGTTATRATATRILGRLFPRYWTPEYAVSGGLRPMSRGKACATYGRDDAVVPLARCRFTDGRLATPIDIPYQRAGGKSCDVASQCAHPKWVRVDLGTMQSVGALAVRGCVPGGAEVSPDGTAFVPYLANDAGDGLLVGPPLPARYVRVDLSRCVYKATEVSVFPPA